MVRLVAADGEQVGIVPIEEAKRVAGDAGLDLVEVAPNAEPPVCRVMDYGKYKYQQAKKAQEGKRKQAHTQLKEIKMRPKIADHDLGFKLKKIETFLEGRNRVKVTVHFRGREIAYADAGRELLARVAELCSEWGQVEGIPRLEGRFMHIILTPR